jgi:hypothetical protein
LPFRGEEGPARVRAFGVGDDDDLREKGTPLYDDLEIPDQAEMHFVGVNRRSRLADGGARFCGHLVDERVMHEAPGNVDDVMRPRREDPDLRRTSPPADREACPMPEAGLRAARHVKRAEPARPRERVERGLRPGIQVRKAEPGASRARWPMRAVEHSAAESTAMERAVRCPRP